MRASNSFADDRRRNIGPRATARVPQSLATGKRSRLAGLYDFGAREQQDQATARFGVDVVRTQDGAKTAAARLSEIEHEPAPQPRMRHQLDGVFGLVDIDEFPARSLIRNAPECGVRETLQGGHADDERGRRKS